jgi:CspA family cold shock protein
VSSACRRRHPTLTPTRERTWPTAPEFAAPASTPTHTPRTGRSGRLPTESVGRPLSDKFICEAVLGSVAMAKGEVDFFNDTGGYGFIDTDESDEDVFFHMEDIGGPDLEEGQEVEFDIVQADKGPRAENLERL